MVLILKKISSQEKLHPTFSQKKNSIGFSKIIRKIWLEFYNNNYKDYIVLKKSFL